MEPPLTLIFNQISPPSLIPSYIPSSDPISLTTPKDLPSPPREFQFPSTTNYSTPLGSVSLGSNLNLDVSLENADVGKNDVLGVKMMIEVQGPSGRFRLGEVIHENKPVPLSSEQDGMEGRGNVNDAEEVNDEIPDSENKLPILKYGEQVNIKVENEIKDLGLNVLIISVAWETLEGRKTFQKFLKFNVNPPLSIKTRIQTPTNPNTLLSPSKREQIYLEILIQNVSFESMILFKSKIFLEPVKGLSVSDGLKSPSNDKGEDGDDNDGKILLLPEDIRQFLFILSPSTDSTTDGKNEEDIAKSSFPPMYTPGTILPLGRLDVSWLSGPYHLPGRLQTSTLNRRVPIPPKTIGQAAAAGGLLPTRSLSSQSNQNIPSGSVNPLPTPSKDRLNNSTNTLLAPSPMRGNLPSPTKEGPEGGEKDQWEFDLTLVEKNPTKDDNEDKREFEVDVQFSMTFKLGVRSSRCITDKTGSSSTRKQSKVEGYTIDGEEKNDDDDDQPLSRISSRVEHEPIPPPLPKIAIQYLTPIPPPSTQTSLGVNAGPQVSVLPPSRTSTPMSPSATSALGGSRPFSPLINSSSRPGTPSSLSNQLRQAQSQGLNSVMNSPRSVTSSRYRDIPLSNNDNNGQLLVDGVEDEEEQEGIFPPSPFIPSSSSSIGGVRSYGNQIINLGNSITVLPKIQDFKKVIENSGPRYDDENDNNNDIEKRKKGSKLKWESQVEFSLDFIGFEQGLHTLGGLRILDLDDEEEGERQRERGSGKIGREWLSLGDISIV